MKSGLTPVSGTQLHYKQFIISMGTRTVLIAAALLGVSLAMFMMMFSIIKNFWKSKRKMLIYVVVALVAFALVSLLGWEGFIDSPNTLLLVFQGCFLILGIAHVWALYSYMDWGKKESVWPDILFSLFIWLIGLIPFYLLYISVAQADGFQYYMLGASIFFIIPFFFTKTFVSALNMPLPDIEKWYYPVHLEIPDPEAHELENPFVITFILPKRAEDVEATNFRAKAPENMNLGGLFYYFVEDFNEQHLDNTLEFTDNFGRPFGWVFYFKPRWYRLFKKRYLNPAKTVKQNGIEENSVIVCERTPVLTEEEEDKEPPALEGKVSTQ